MIKNLPVSSDIYLPGVFSPSVQQRLKERYWRGSMEIHPSEPQRTTVLQHLCRIIVLDTPLLKLLKDVLGEGARLTDENKDHQGVWCFIRHRPMADMLLNQRRNLDGLDPPWWLGLYPRAR